MAFMPCVPLCESNKLAKLHASKENKKMSLHKEP